MQVKPTGGCIKCAKCEKVRMRFFCGRTKLTDKQLYNTKGYCSKFVPKSRTDAKQGVSRVIEMEGDAE